MTYGELDERAGRLGRRLRELGVGRDTLVGLFVGRTPAMLVAMLAVLKAGGAYVPLDPAFPADRLAFMVKDSGLRLVVTEHSLEAEMPPHDGHVLFLDDAQSYAAEALPMASEPVADALAYVIYTSGSTGKPKGVMVPHRSVVNFLSSVAKAPGLTERDTVLAVDDSLVRHRRPRALAAALGGRHRRARIARRGGGRR